MSDRKKYLSPDAETVTNEAGAKQSYLPWRFDLLDPEAMFAMTAVLGHGAEKYGEDNWRAISVRDHLNHLITHAFAALAGDSSDDHFSHMMCRAMFATATHMREEEMKNLVDPSSTGDITPETGVEGSHLSVVKPFLLLLKFEQGGVLAINAPGSIEASKRGCSCPEDNEFHAASCSYLITKIDSVGYQHRGTAKQEWSTSGNGTPTSG